MIQLFIVLLIFYSVISNYQEIRTYNNNIKNIDDTRFFKWCLARYFHSADQDLAIIRKNDKDFARQTDFKHMKISVKCRYIHKIDKKRTVSALVFFLVMNTWKIPNLCLTKYFQKTC